MNSARVAPIGPQNGAIQESMAPQVSSKILNQRNQEQEEAKRSQAAQQQTQAYAQHTQSSLVEKLAENSDRIYNGDDGDEDDDVQGRSIKIDFLKDLNTEISNQQLKNFILDQLQVNELTIQLLYNLIKEGAQLNNFIHINDSIINSLIKSLDLQLDAKVQLSAREKLAQNTKKIVNANRFIKGMKEEVIKKKRRRSTYVSVKFAKDQDDQFIFNFAKNFSSQLNTTKKKKQGGFCCIFDQVCKAYSCMMLLTIISIGIFCVSGFTVPQAIIDFSGDGIIFA